MPIDGLTLDQAVGRVIGGLEAGKGGAVLTPNLDVLRQYRHSPELRAVFEDVELLVPDGVPLVWASAIQGTPLPQRITGSDMLAALAAAGASRGATVFCAGGRIGVPERAADHLARTYPGLRTLSHDCYVRPGPLDPQLEEVSEAIVAAAPELVYVGLPFAGQERCITTLRPRLPQTWFLGMGSCFDFLTGDRPRAPVWLQRMGLEWAHRLVHEPETYRRYLIQGLPFAARLGLHALRRRVTGRQPPA